MTNHDIFKELGKGTMQKRTSHGSLFIEDGILYSYGHHFPLALHAQGFVLVNGNGTTPTTAKQRSQLVGVLSRYYSKDAQVIPFDCFEAAGIPVMRAPELLWKLEITHTRLRGTTSFKLHYEGKDRYFIWKQEEAGSMMFYEVADEYIDLPLPLEYQDNWVFLAPFYLEPVSVLPDPLFEYKFNSSIPSAASGGDYCYAEKLAMRIKDGTIEEVYVLGKIVDKGNSSYGKRFKMFRTGDCWYKVHKEHYISCSRG